MKTDAVVAFEKANGPMKLTVCGKTIFWSEEKMTTGSTPSRPSSEYTNC